MKHEIEKNNAQPVATYFAGRAVIELLFIVILLDQSATGVTAVVNGGFIGLFGICFCGHLYMAIMAWGGDE